MIINSIKSYIAIREAQIGRIILSLLSFSSRSLAHGIDFFLLRFVYFYLCMFFKKFAKTSKFGATLHTFAVSRLRKKETLFDGYRRS